MILRRSTTLLLATIMVTLAPATVDLVFCLGTNGHSELRRVVGTEARTTIANVEAKPVTVVRTIKHAIIPAALGALIAGWTGGWDITRIAAGAGIGGLSGALL